MRTLQCSTCGTTTFAPDQPTLRDRFAMAALTGFYSSDTMIQVSRETAEQMGEEFPEPTIARMCYAMADAMLLARTRPAAGGARIDAEMGSGTPAPGQEQA